MIAKDTGVPRWPEIVLSDASSSARVDHPAAEVVASQALQKYGLCHPDLPKLAHDVAHLWCEPGYFERALTVFRSLLPHFTCPGERFRGLVSAARAAGGARDERFYLIFSEEAQSLIVNATIREEYRTVARAEDLLAQVLRQEAFDHPAPTNDTPDAYGR